MRRVYLDSNVFISLIDREIGKGVRGLFVEAEQFLERVKESGDVLVLSDLFFREVQRKTGMKQESVIAYLENEQVEVETVQQKEPNRVRKLLGKGIHFSDALHVDIALRENCDCIVTFNVKDFENVRELIGLFEPAEF